MFEQETDTIIDKIIRSLPQAAYPTVSMKDILAANIPSPIKTFFRAHVETLLMEELEKHRASSRFNFSYPEVQTLQDQINSILVLNYNFEREEFETKVDETVHILINYLVRPQWTLVSMIFEKDKTISSKILLRMLRYFAPYDYLKEIICRYFAEKHIESITREEFISLLWKIDGEFIKRKTGDELSKIISPLYDFFDFQNKTGSYILPIKAIIKFFEDKGLVMVMPQLEGELAQGKNELGLNDLSSLLEDVRRLLGIFQVEKIEVDHKELIEKSVAIDPESNQINHKTDLAKAIGESDRRKFIKKIFNQDEDTFLSTLESINKLSNWKQASKFIDEIFISQNIDPYSSEAKKFIEVIFDQYHSKQD